MFCRFMEETGGAASRTTGTSIFSCGQFGLWGSRCNSQFQDLLRQPSEPRVAAEIVERWLVLEQQH